MTHALLALSPLDGRYADKVAPVRACFCEFALIKARVTVEIAWLRLLANEPKIAEIPAWSAAAEAFLQQVVADFSVADAEHVKALEAQTNHDVKAVEYFLKQRLSACPELSGHLEFIHFACTSEDINNLAYALLLQQCRATVLLPALRALMRQLTELAERYRTLPMLARTHGQSATPTTLGKEWWNVYCRLQRQVKQLEQLPILAKFNGAVGNYNAHCLAYPHVDWLAMSRQLIHGFDLSLNPFTTQIEPHDYVAEWLHSIVQINTILIDLARDCWGYISLGYLAQRSQAQEVGSSTMPHKINPIDFENGEGNLALANALASGLAQRLPISRWQRDLVDSTLLRNVGSAFAYAYLGWHSLQRGLNKVYADQQKIAEDLNQHPEVLAEAIQTVMRRYGLALPYEQLKQLTRGQHVSLTALQQFIAEQDLPAAVKQQLLALTPATYLGLAADFKDDNQ